eukprot:TRINITY_DN19298_c0_g1_i1.p1 TRINITY_DN19298_c0_g1~~TRINITY_DN19298_c0_g1_i1.p1  ORF type:complete len:298 (-),score=76.71 TRINITY_DN19298_c0_g1_i1:179-1072(-)
MLCFFFLIIRLPPRSTLSSSSAASDVYKRQEMYRETHAEQPFEYKQQTVLGIEEETIRLFKTFKWNDPKRDEQGAVRRHGFWESKEIKQSMCKDLTGTRVLSFREAGTSSRIASLQNKLRSLDRQIGSSMIAMSAQRERNKLQEELDSLLESPVVRVESNLDTSDFWVEKGEAFQASSGSVNVNVNVNRDRDPTDAGPKPPDEPLGTRTIVRVLPEGQRVYALGVVRRDPTERNRLVFAQNTSGPFMLGKGCEEDLRKKLREDAEFQANLGDILCTVGKLTATISLGSIVIRADSKE